MSKPHIFKSPCGCETWTENNIFYVKPCSLTCERYLYAIEQSKKHGNKIIMQEVGKP